MRLCLMIEGQEDVTWAQWRALGQVCEESGLEGLFRSDHYGSVQGRDDRGSLDAWTTIGALAAITKRIRLGTLVSPVTFRHPSVLAKAVVTADHVSGGRVEVGMGAGWLAAEHRAYGFPFPETAARMEMLEEQVEIVRRSWSEGSFDFAGRHYRIEKLDARPKPSRGDPNLIIGGRGNRRSARLAARFGDEYNTIFATPEECRRRRAAVEEAWEKAERDPGSLVFSLMTGCIVGADGAEVRRRAERVMALSGETGSVDDWLSSVADEWVTGTVEEVQERVAALSAAGVDRVMLQHQAHDDIEMVALLGEEVARPPL